MCIRDSQITITIKENQFKKKKPKLKCEEAKIEMERKTRNIIANKYHKQLFHTYSRYGLN